MVFKREEFEVHSQTSLDLRGVRRVRHAQQKESEGFKLAGNEGVWGVIGNVLL